MKKRTINRKSLDELAAIMPVLSEQKAKMCIGGSGNDFVYSIDSFNRMIDSGSWNGGLVEYGGAVYRVEVTSYSLESSQSVTGNISDSVFYDNGSGNYTDVPFIGFRGDDRFGCFRRCKEMLGGVGVTPMGIDGNIFLVNPTSTGQAGGKAVSYQEAIKYLNGELAAGRPVIVGVDHSTGSQNNDKMTDHFVVIASQNEDGNYHFFDPATSSKERGTSPNNIFRIEKDKMTGKFKEKKYTVTLVRRNN